MLNTYSGQDLINEFRSRSNWAGMTLGQFQTAVETFIWKDIYTNATEQQWMQLLLPKYKETINYAVYAMGATAFPFSDKQEWTVEDFCKNMAAEELDSNAKHNFLAGYLNTYFYKMINFVLLRDLKEIISANSGISMDYLVDYFITQVVFKEVVDANPGKEFVYYQIQGVPATRVQALKAIRNDIISAWQVNDEPALFKHLYYLMTYFSGSTYRGVHKAVLFLLGYDDYAEIREKFYAKVECIIEQKGNVRIGRITL